MTLKSCLSKWMLQQEVDAFLTDVERSVKYSCELVPERAERCGGSILTVFQGPRSSLGLKRCSMKETSALAAKNLFHAGVAEVG